MSFSWFIFSNLKILDPKQAKDVDAQNAFNNDFALFATENICLAIIFSLINKEILTRTITTYDWSVCWPESNGVFKIYTKLPKHWQNDIEKISGCVYVLTKDSFCESDKMQWKSKIAVVPIAIGHVTLEDFYATGGKIEWV